MSHARDLIDFMEVAGETLADVDPAPWDTYDRSQVLHAVHRLDIAVHGLADRIRMAGVNNKPVPLPPSRPAPKPGTTAPKPDDPPPPPPPPTDGKQ